MLSLQKHTILVNHEDKENSKKTSSVYRVLLSKQHTHTHIQMHICQQTNVTCITHPTVTHTHHLLAYTLNVAHRGLSKWWGMEEISTLIAHFIYTGKAQGIWSMFTYGGECSIQTGKCIAVNSKQKHSVLKMYVLQKYQQISERKEQDTFFFFLRTCLLGRGF